MATDTNVDTLIINKMTEEQYKGLATKSPTELYLTTDSKQPLHTVAHDDTLSGSGTAEDPLTVVSSGGVDNNGIAGDYHTHFGIIDAPNGMPTQGTGNTVNIPAGLVMSIPGSDSYVTFGSAETHAMTSTVDCALFYARETDGTNAMYVEATDVHYSETEPAADGVTGFQAWYNPSHGKWQLRSNDTGNVWRDIVGGPMMDLKFLDGNLVRIDFIGYRLLNKQDFATKEYVQAIVGNISTVLDTINGEAI